MSEDSEKRMTVRLPVELHAQIENAARDQRRSLNSQIIVLLQQALKLANQEDASERDQ